MNSVITTAQKVLNSTLGLINGSLGDGFTQLSNYMKAQVGAQEQIADANNMVQAELDRDVRAAQQRDNHATNRQDCLNLEGGQAAIVAARNGVAVATALDSGKDKRTQAGKERRPGKVQGRARRPITTAILRFTARMQKRMPGFARWHPPISRMQIRTPPAC